MSPTTANMAIPQAVTAERKAASAKTLSPVLIRGLSGLATGSALASLDPAVPASALFSGVGLAGVRFLGSAGDRKSTRLNSSHQIISYAVFCLKKKKHADETALYPHTTCQTRHTPPL